MGPNEANDLYAPRSRQDNVTILEHLMAAKTADEQQLWFRRAQEHFHPSLLAECDYRVSYVQREHWQDVAHRVITLYLFTLHQNALPRPPHPSVAVNTILAALGEYRSAVAGHQLTLDEHLDVAERTQRDIFPSPPSCTSRIKLLIEKMQADVASSRSGSELVAIIESTLKNAELIVLDAPATRIDALRYIFRRRDDGQGGVSCPVDSLDSDENSDRLLSWLDEFKEKARDAQLDDVSEVTHAALLAVTAKRNDGTSVFDGEWSCALTMCARCSMAFASRTPAVLDQDCPSIASGGGFLFFRRNLNRSECIFCGLDSYLEGPGFLHWRDRNLIVYRLPLIPLDDEANIELNRPVIEAMRERYAARLPAAERDAFDQAVEVVAYGWREWLQAVQLGDVAAEDHMVLVTNPEGDEEGRILIDITKMFMRELGDDEYRQIDPERKRHIERQMAELDDEVVSEIVQRVVEEVKETMAQKQDEE